MSQTYTDDCFAADHVAVTDMQNIENNFAAVKSSFSGTSAPSNIVGGMLWHDSTARKVRNYASTAWLASLMGDATFKVPVYRNDTCEGWTIDTSVTDRVVALKGGSNAYNVNGGNAAGTWSQTTHTHAVGSFSVPAHVHQWYNHVGPGNNAQTYNSSGVAFDFSPTGASLSSTYEGIEVITASGSEASVPDAYTSPKVATAITGTSAASGTASTWRPAAVVCTLQYPDLS